MQDLSLHKKIFTAITKVAIAEVIVHAIGVARYMIVAGMFGLSADVDMFLIAVMLPQFVLGVASNTFQTVIIPSFIQGRKEQAANENAIIKSILSNSIVILVILTAILLVIFPYSLKLLAPSLTPDACKRTVMLFYAFLPSLLFGGVSAVLAGLLNAYEKFTIPSLVPGIVTISGIIFVVLLGYKIGLMSLSVGLSFGAVVECLVMIWYLGKLKKVDSVSFISRVISKRLQIIQEVPDEASVSTIQPETLILKDKPGTGCQTRRILGNYAILTIGTLSFGLLPIIDRSMASSLGTGSVAALEYGSRIIVLITAFGCTALGTGIFPYLVQMGDKPAMLLRTFRMYNRLLAFLSVLATILFFYGSELLVRVMFERGAFRASDSEYVASVQRFCALQIPFYLLGTVGTRILAAWMKFGWISTIAVIDVVIKIVLNYYFIQYMGINGIALSTSMMYAVSCLLVYFAIYINFKTIIREEQDGNSML
jgi:putative peptidoglycan lipid II flippase